MLPQIEKDSLLLMVRCLLAIQMKMLSSAPLWRPLLSERGTPLPPEALVLAVLQMHMSSATIAVVPVVALRLQQDKFFLLRKVHRSSAMISSAYLLKFFTSPASLQLPSAPGLLQPPACSKPKSWP
jgi:hypothetical protein